jgi:LmbE family N-acetylglucosaminyl deacetylase
VDGADEPLDTFPDDWERALAVVAHPDDLEYGVASAIARWTRQGKEVVYVLATSGEAGIASKPPDETGPLREEEERESAALVGVHALEFLGHPDGLVEYGVPLRRDIARAIRAHRPEVVITSFFDLTWGPGGNVNHADHRHVGLAAVDACRDAANRWLFPGIGEPWEGVQAIYVAAGAPATHYVDVTDTIDAGIASLRAHRAYLAEFGDFDPDAMLRGFAQSTGEQVGAAYAIPFRRLN